MKWSLATLVLSLTSLHLYAQADLELKEGTCEPLNAEVVHEGETQKIYPFKPLPTKVVTCRIKRLTEKEDFLTDIRLITGMGLQSANTKVQPWGGYFWALNQGQIANPYLEKNYEIFHGATNGVAAISWKHNYKNFLSRKEKLYPKIFELDEKGLSQLAPSEKYDLLLGDTSFDLTNRVWKYASTWGEKKQWGFLSSIDIPAGYELPKAPDTMALWEGICHGWAVAAGHEPRPEQTVWVTLPNQKRMPFYPNDLKALASLMWANSTIQDAVIVEGLRCNQNRPEKDDNGRFIDTKLDRGDKSLLPRCADVHPAVYHAAIINILGIEGRSFVIDKSSSAHISNQPVAGYSYSYFNPETGKEGTLESSSMSVSAYAKDPFRASRNPEAKYIVGVAMTLKYLGGDDPALHETNFPSDDKVEDLKFNYDLELSADYKIIGGQWRVNKDGSARVLGNTTHQPDFFWVVPRDFKKYFKPKTGLPEWNFARSTLPPKEFASAAKEAHAFVYQVTREFGFNEKCTVFPMKPSTAKPKDVDCEFKYGRPQPLVNVVEKLLEEAQR